MGESEMLEAVELNVYPMAAATMTEAGRGWFGRKPAVKAARRGASASGDAAASRATGTRR